jgi:hypothetical protein
MTQKIRHVFQPRDLVEVSDQEAQVLDAQGLLWKGSEQDLQELLDSDPIGPLDPPRITTPSTAAAPAAKPTAPTTPPATPAAGAKES